MDANKNSATDLGMGEERLSEDFPYDKRLNKKDYYETLRNLQIELLKLQRWVKAKDKKLMIVFEGIDAAGKGGSIKRFTEYLNPRGARIVALNKPSEIERTQWYFQRYVAHLPAAGEIVLFDRSWYNRAGVERVMNFCTKEQYDMFMRHAPSFESQLVESDKILVKFWFDVSRDVQQERLQARKDDPLKRWKLSPIDAKASELWDDYQQAKLDMLNGTHSEQSPWTIVRSNDKRRARINSIKHVLSLIDYDNKDTSVVADIDNKILFSWQ